VERVKTEFMSAQFVRFGLVGLGSNIILYLVYLLCTYLGMSYLLAVVISYFVGIVASFFSNKGWTFTYRGNAKAAFTRYVLVYLIGLALNLFLLYTLVERFLLRHEIVQGILIAVFAILFFIVQRTWIFPKTTQIEKSEGTGS
jgi:putative flippase GtrA